MHKAKFFLLFLFFLSFHTFLFSSSNHEKEASKKTAEIKSPLNEVEDFSFKASRLVEKIFKKPRKYYLKGKTKKAYETLRSYTEEMIYNKIFKKNSSFFQRIFSPLNKKSLSFKNKTSLESFEKIKFLRNYALGMWSLELHHPEMAIYHLNLSIEQVKKDHLKPLIHYYLGLSHLKLGNLNDGKKALKKVFSYEDFKNQNLFQKSFFALSKIYLEEKQWKQASKHLRYLEKKWRIDKKHPEILWKLMKIAKERKKKNHLCRWARKIYSLYPNHPLAFNWTFSLEESLFEKKPLNCKVHYTDLKRRILNLQRFGESRKAENEIKKIKEKIKKERAIALDLKNPKSFESFLLIPSETKKIYNRKRKYKKRIKVTKTQKIKMIEDRFDLRFYKIDSLFALFLIYEGFPKKAFQILYKYFNEKKTDFKYLKLFGKASRESENYKLAVNAYYENSRTTSKTKSSVKSLFYSGFLSFRFKDYDNAYKIFQEFKRTYKKSKLYPHVFWYTAWIQYLKADHLKALELFQEILDLKEKNQRLFKGIPDKKIHYWIGVSYLKLGEKNQAKNQFFKLLSDRRMNYYTIAAYYRLQTMNIFSKDQSIRDIFEQQEKTRINSKSPSFFELENDLLLSSNTEEENNETLMNDKNENNEIDVDVKEEEKVLWNNKNFEKTLHLGKTSKSIKWHKMREKFEMIKKLIHIGDFYWAKWSLYEIELNTKESTYRKLLIKAYKEIQSFHRSSYISTVHFDEEKEALGLFAGELLWKNSFPQAYFNFVKHQSEKLKVSKSLIWAVMKTESSYRYNSISPVGAKGLMQLMPYTAYKVRERLLNQPNSYGRNLMDPKINIEIGVAYMKHLLKMFSHQIPLAAAAYNAGPHRVKKWISVFSSLETDAFIENIPFIETRNYVKKVLRNYKIYQYLYENKKNTINWFIQPIAMISKKELEERKAASLNF